MCTLFFVSELFTEVFGLRHWALPWQLREILQVLASLGLMLGTFASAALLRQSVRHTRSMERQLRSASGAFFDAMEEGFREWGLSSAERDVALFAVRGLSNAEIANLRKTSQATIKSQMNAVFKKSGVSSRAQLLSQFVEMLIEVGTKDFADFPQRSTAAGDKILVQNSFAGPIVIPSPP